MWSHYTCGLVITTAITNYSKNLLALSFLKKIDLVHLFVSNEGISASVFKWNTLQQDHTVSQPGIYIKERAKSAALYIQIPITLGSGQVLHTR